MYLDFYDFRKEPFQTTPDAEFLFLSPSHKEALASIIYGIEQRKGFIAITGEVGVGKTTILRSYLESVDKRHQKTIYIFNPKVTFEHLLSTILHELGAEPVSNEATEMVNQLHEFLIAEYRKRGVVVLVIDEAQNIPPETLEGIRLLSNLETSTEKLIQLVLVGQPELETLLNRHELRQVRQRIAVRAKIFPLTERESLAYIEHRLAHVSTTKRAIFSKEALELIVKTAQGIPRSLNILCDNALITGFGYRKPTISRKIVQEVIADFSTKRSRPVVWRPRHAFAFVALIIVVVALFLYLDSGVKLPGVSVAALESERPDVNAPQTPIDADVGPSTSVTTVTPVIPSPSVNPASPVVTEVLTAERAELAETARLLTVLLDSGRVVVGRAQPNINNPRLEDKGFSSNAFEGQLRKEFLTRTGHDLRNLAPAPMPERAKPLLVRLAFFMQKSVQEAQPLINKKGIGFKGFIPATFGTKVAQDFSRDTGIRLRQIGPPGVPPRNPDNKPDDQEEQALLAIQKSHPRIGDHAVEQQLTDSAVRVLLPLFYNRQCLGCHGKPKGEVDISGYPKEGAKEGDLGGAISVIITTNRKMSRGEKGG